jgi:hypothetical protein
MHEVAAHNEAPRDSLGERSQSELSHILDDLTLMGPSARTTINVSVRVDRSGAIHHLPAEQTLVAKHTRGGPINRLTAKLVNHNGQLYIEVANRFGGHDSTAWLKEHYPSSGWLGRGEKPVGFELSPMVAEGAGANWSPFKRLLPQSMDRDLAIKINAQRANAMINSIYAKMGGSGLHDERIHVRFSDDSGHDDLTDVHSVHDIAGILAASASSARPGRVTWRRYSR